MYNIGIIGDYEGICGFAALGIDTYPVDNIDDARRTLKKIADSNYAIIYITEYYIENMPDLFIKYQDEQVPAIIPIPSVKGATGFGVRNTKRYVEQAVGADIAFNDNE